MIWAIDNDDFAAECSSLRYPLLRTIHSTFKEAAEEGGVPAVVEPVTTPSPDLTGRATSLSSLGVSAYILFFFLTTVIISGSFWCNVKVTDVKGLVYFLQKKV